MRSTGEKTNLVSGHLVYRPAKIETEEPLESLHIAASAVREEPSVQYDCHCLKTTHLHRATMMERILSTSLQWTNCAPSHTQLHF